MPEEIEIYPVITAPSFRAIQDLPVKGSTFVEVVYRNSNMKRSNGRHRYLIYGKI
jgi:hypothetical protein